MVVAHSCHTISLSVDTTIVKSMIRCDGAYMVVAAGVTGLLANGVDPVRVAGYTTLLYTLFILALKDLDLPSQVFGVDLGFFAVLVGLILAGIAVGTLQ